MKVKHDLINLSEILSEIERTYPVEQWEVKGIQFWPILKNIVYFEDRTWKPTFQSISSIFLDRKSFQSAKRKIFNRLGWNKSKSMNVIRTVPKTKILFSGANPHRTLFKSEYWNRYFDPIMDEIEDEIAPFMVDYSDDKLDPLYKEYRVTDLASCSIRRKIKEELEIDSDSFYHCEGFKKALTHLIPVFDGDEKKLLKTLIRKIVSIIEFKAKWDYIIVQAEPDIVFCLCYYNEPMYGLLLAAREKGIPTVDMQHGGQGVLHPAYHFSSSEDKSYNTLPDIFWVWESSAAKQLNNCFKSTHRAFVGGNPWITYLVEQQHFHQELATLGEKKIIICTLTINVESILPDFLLSAILQSSEYEWWLRFHPRTPGSERNELARIIKDNRIEDKVEIIKANEWPLPVLLTIAWGHVSHSSGSLFEASIVGLRRNVVTSETGANNFKDLINESKVFYYDPITNKEGLIHFIESLKVTDDETINNQRINYIDSIYALIKQHKKYSGTRT